MGLAGSERTLTIRVATLTPGRIITGGHYQCSYTMPGLVNAWMGALCG